MGVLDLSQPHMTKTSRKAKTMEGQSGQFPARPLFLHLVQVPGLLFPALLAL